jgi:hypothetical protein
MLHRESRSVRRVVSSITAFLLAFSQSALPLFAAEFTVFEKSYVRESGKPVTVTDGFDVINPDTDWLLRAVNGSLEDDTVEQVSSST